LIEGDYDFELLPGHDRDIVGCADIRKGAIDALGFVVKPDYSIEQISSGCLIVTESEQVRPGSKNNYIVVADARATFIKLVNSIMRELDFQAAPMRVSPEAIIHPAAIIEGGVGIEAGAVISAGCVIRRGTRIGVGTIVQEN